MGRRQAGAENSAGIGRRDEKAPAKDLPTRATYEALAEFRYALRCFLAFSEKAAAAAGLTPQQHQALLAISGCPTKRWLSVGEIADRLLLRHHSAVELVDRLAELGFVERRADAEDRRRIQVWVSKAGDRALRKLSSTHVEELQSILPTLHELLSRFGPRSRRPQRLHHLRRE